jgi:NADH dehydrogenase [ubiquinone] 1 alpha subcomplex assembly factor 6
MNDSIDICLETLRTSDRARYLCTLWAPKAHRPALAALHAFCTELSRIRGLVSEPMLGEIRLAWWREAIEGVYADKPREHPVLQALTQTSVKNIILLSEMHALIEARESEIFEAPMMSVADVEIFAAQTAGAQNRLVAKIVGAQIDQQLESAKDIGTAWGLLSIALAVLFQGQNQRHSLPHDELHGVGIDPETLFSHPLDATIVPVIRNICARAEKLLQDAANPNPPRECRLIGAWTRDYLRRLHKSDYDISRPNPDEGDVRRQFMLFRCALTGIY